MRHPSIRHPHPTYLHATHDETLRLDGKLVQGNGNREYATRRSNSLPTLHPRAIPRILEIACQKSR